MMISTSHAIGIVIICAVVTMLLRGIPFLIWGGKRKVPDIILWFGDVLPYAIMMMLVVFALRNVSLSEPGGISGWLPAACGVTVTAASYAWKKSTLVSIFVGTVVFMVLTRVI